MRPLKLGHVGILHDHSSAKLECAKKFPELFEIVGLVPEDAQKQKDALAKVPYAGVPVMTREELLAAGVEAVLVETLELDLVKEAQFWVDHGVHVHIDKPAGGDVESLRKLLKTAKEKHVAVQFAYMYRYNAAYLDCQRRIANGEMGELFEVDAVMNTCHSPEKRAWLGNFKGGIQFFLGCHMVDLVLRLQGIPDAIHPFLKSTGFDGVNTVDHAMAVFEYPNGVSIVRATSTEVNGYGRRQLVVCGKKATYEIEPLEAPTHAYFIPVEQSKTYRDCRVEVELPPFDGKCRYDELLKDFTAFIRGEKENPYSATYELTLQKILLYCCGQTDIDYHTVEEI